MQAQDSGQYECQVSTTPVMSHHVYLKVAGMEWKNTGLCVTISFLEPRTEIVGGPNIYLEEGFTMNLTCLVRDSPEPPQYIFWYHNKEVQYNTVQYTIIQ